MFWSNTNYMYYYYSTMIALLLCYNIYVTLIFALLLYYNIYVTLILVSLLYYNICATPFILLPFFLLTFLHYNAYYHMDSTLSYLPSPDIFNDHNCRGHTYHVRLASYSLDILETC